MQHMEHEDNQMQHMEQEDNQMQHMEQEDNPILHMEQEDNQTQHMDRDLNQMQHMVQDLTLILQFMEHAGNPIVLCMVPNRSLTMFTGLGHNPTVYMEREASQRVYMEPELLQIPLMVLEPRRTHCTAQGHSLRQPTVVELN